MPLPPWALALADSAGKFGEHQAMLATVTSLPELDERALVAEAQAGNRAAFEELVRRYDRDVLRLALNLMKRPEDQAPEVLVNRNEDGTRDFFEVQREHRPTLDPERSLIGKEIRLRLAKAMDRLSPRERVVFEMKHDQGLKLRAEQPVTLSGNLDDSDMRRVLTYVVKNSDRFDPGVRLDCLDALRAKIGDSEIRDALLEAARRDKNPAVRMKALESLREKAAVAEMRGVPVEKL